VAARGKVVEKRATVAGVGRRPAAKWEGSRRAATGRVRASMVSDRVLAIMDAGGRGAGGLSLWVVVLRLKLVAGTLVTARL